MWWNRKDGEGDDDDDDADNNDALQEHNPNNHHHRHHNNTYANINIRGDQSSSNHHHHHHSQYHPPKKRTNGDPLKPESSAGSGVTSPDNNNNFYRQSRSLTDSKYKQTHHRHRHRHRHKLNKNDDKNNNNNTSNNFENEKDRVEDENAVLQQTKYPEAAVHGTSSNCGTVAETHMGFEVSLDTISPESAVLAARTLSPSSFLSGSSSSSFSLQKFARNKKKKNNTRAIVMGTNSNHHHHHRTNQTMIKMKPVINLQDDLNARQKIHKAQFAVSQWPALGSQPQQLLAQQQLLLQRSQLLTSSRLHRVQFQHEPLATTSTTTSFEDAMFLLRSHEVVDEMTLVKEELMHLNAELDALHKDQARLEEIVAGRQQGIATPPAIAAAAAAAAHQANGNNTNVPDTWDVQELLTSRNITVAQRDFLQAKRGTDLTVYFHDKKAAEALAQKCNIKPHVLSKYKQSNRSYGNDISNNASGGGAHLLELNPETCREGGAATHLQHISLLCKEGGTELAFFLARDAASATKTGVHWGHLPDRLYRRMQSSSGLNNPKQSASELTYLSTGPMDAYYAQFKSGEAWWGTAAVEDPAFSQICTEWNVYRVVFGPALVVDDGGDVATAAAAETPQSPNAKQTPVSPPNSQSNQQQQQQQHVYSVSSWIILSRDGRAAWKNLPSRLDHLLQSRTADQAGLAEVSLGCGDSYYCRFLDGMVDYCLPSTLADVCRQLEERGSTITGIALNPELSHDFVIRSSPARSFTTY